MDCNRCCNAGNRGGCCSLVVVARIWQPPQCRARGSGSRAVPGRPVPAPAGEASTAASGPASNPTAPRPGEIIITLSPDKLANAKIETEAVIVDVSSSVAGGAGGAGIRAAGTVQSNAYKEVP